MGRLDLDMKYERQKHDKANGYEYDSKYAPQPSTISTEQELHLNTILEQPSTISAEHELHLNTILEQPSTISAEHELQLNTILDKRNLDKGNTYTERYQLMMIISKTELTRRINDDGDTALHISAKLGDLAVTNLLLRRGQELGLNHIIERKNKQGNTPLHEALIHNHTHLVNVLLHSGEHWSCYVNNKGKSPFYLSVEAGNVHAFNAILKADFWSIPDMDAILDECLINGRSVLHAAIKRKDKVMLQKILAKGIHMLLHYKDENGHTPVEYASIIGFTEGYILLNNLNGINEQVVKHNLDALCPSLVDDKEVTQSPEWEVRHERMRKMLKKVTLLPQQGTSHDFMDLGLYEAAKKGDIDEFISALEQFSVERNLGLPTIFSQLTPLQNTFLHVASRYECKDLLWLIIKYFPLLLFTPNSHGDTPLHLAAREGKVDAVEILVKFRNKKVRQEGMQMISENNVGQTPLQLALKSDHDIVAEFMIKENVEEAYHANKEGVSSLYMVILKGKTKQIKSIFNTVSHCVDQKVLDEQLTKGKSLVLAAIWSQKIEILQELAIQKPLLFEYKDEDQKKLVHFAELLGFHEGVNCLLSLFRLEIVVGNIVGDVTPVSSLHSYRLDAFSLSVINMVDPNIEKVLKVLRYYGRDARMRQLLCNSSLQQMPQEHQHVQSMDVRLYEAVKKGDIDRFITALEMASEANNSFLHTVSEQTTHIGNTFLHVAAACGHRDLTILIIYYFQNLLRKQNKKGNTANHLAARAGHLEVVDILVRFNNYDDQLYSSMERYYSVERSRRNKWWLKNSAGNTSLNEAFVDNQIHVIEYLIASSVEEAFSVNKEGKSGLYHAIEAGMVDVVKTTLNNMSSDVDADLISKLPTGKSLINAAIRRRSRVMLQEILTKIPAQIHIIDEDGQTPLFYAVSTGFLEGVNCLLDEFKMNSSQMNSTGFYPVHVASKSGHLHILEKLMQNCPDAGGFRNGKDQNILHVAAIYGTGNIVRFILQTPDLAFLINEIDDDGNTPLHLAAINWHPKIVSSLTWDGRINLALVNKDGLTALDVTERCMEPVTSFQQRLTWSALMSAGAPRAGNTYKIYSRKHGSSEKREQNNADRSNDRVNTLLLVATLVATVTFAAGFTVPGGYNSSSEPNPGQATLLHKIMLQIFVMCDTIALYSAIMVAVTLIWAQLGDLTLVVNALSFAIPLLGLSLTTMFVAFMVGVSLVVGDLTWLANFVLIFGIICLASVLTLFIPLCLPYTSTSKVFRYITYYPFCLLVLASGSSDHMSIKEQ